ncbi:MAG: S1 family peptidase [Pseudomonadota bacterium]|nr:S1 family peptidase [Pseudomonadota bacterium]
MNKYSLFGITATAIFLSTGSLAQSSEPVSERPEVDPARVAPAHTVQRSEFSDPGNAKAKHFAQERGTSIGEATSKLRRQAALAMFIERLKDRHPDTFSYVAVNADSIEVGLTDPSIDITALLPPGLATVQKVQAVYSEKGTYARLEELKRQLVSAGLKDVSVGVNPETGRIELLTKTAQAAVQRAIASGAIDSPHGIEVIEDEIIPLGYIDAGKAYNVDPTYCSDYCGGTTGFSLGDYAGTRRYTSTAGHMDNNRARYNTSLTSSYSSGGDTLQLPTDMFNYSLDIQYAQPTDTAGDTPVPYFWDGSTYVPVENYTYPTENVVFCKFGRVTKKTCGTHGPTTVYSNPQWNANYLRRIPNPGTGTSFVQEGDSGGPVFYGNWALGWIHGRNGNYDLYYTPVSDFKSVQQVVDLIVLK